MPKKGILGSTCLIVHALLLPSPSAEFGAAKPNID